jgi:hypothetical protein
VAALEASIQIEVAAERDVLPCHQTNPIAGVEDHAAFGVTFVLRSGPRAPVGSRFTLSPAGRTVAGIAVAPKEAADHLLPAADLRAGLDLLDAVGTDAEVPVLHALRHLVCAWRVRSWPVGAGEKQQR